MKLSDIKRQLDAVTPKGSKPFNEEEGNEIVKGFKKAANYFVVNGKQQISNMTMSEHIKELTALYQYFNELGGDQPNRDLLPKELLYLFLFIHDKNSKGIPLCTELKGVLNNLKNAMGKLYADAEQLANYGQLTCERFEDLITSRSWWVQLRFHCFWKWQQSKPLPTLPKIKISMIVNEDPDAAKMVPPARKPPRPGITPQFSPNGPVGFSMPIHNRIAEKYGYGDHPKASDSLLNKERKRTSFSIFGRS